MSPDAQALRQRTVMERLALYALSTLVICGVAAVVGEMFFPAELRGDTGGNDFAGLAALAWAFGAFILCVVAAAGTEIYLGVRGRK